MTAGPLKRLRIVGFLEGISFLVLLGIAMPLKYYAGYPMAVKITGWAHGVLFMAYIYALIQAYFEYGWTIKKALIAFIASCIPFGTFYMEPKWKKEETSLYKTLDLRS